jgi:diguanylate cyclase (GGDEF)-like protein
MGSCLAAPSRSPSTLKGNRPVRQETSTPDGRGPEGHLQRGSPIGFQPASLLIADGDPTVIEFLTHLLREEGYQVEAASDAQQTLKRSREEHFRVIVVDLELPTMEPLELVRELREVAPDSELIVLTRYDSMETAVEAMKLGAIDYITKPFHIDHVRIVVAKTLERRRLQQLAHDGQFYKRLSRVDGLTELYNHKFFHQLLDAEVERAQRYERHLSVLMIDIDHFKIYNDANGHPVGDMALEKIAWTLKTCTRKCDFIARYGGEEFAVIVPETSKAVAVRIAERLRKAVQDAEFEGESVVPEGRLTVSVGVAGYPEDGPGKRDLIARADRALYQAKQQGRNRVCASPDRVAAAAEGNASATSFDQPPLQSA